MVFVAAAPFAKAMPFHHSKRIVLQNPKTDFVNVVGNRAIGFILTMTTSPESFAAGLTAIAMLGLAC